MGNADQTHHDREGRLALHYAAVEGRTEEVVRLIAEGEDVAAGDNAQLTPLHMACQQGHVEVARALIEAGAPVDARDCYGNTPLWKAVFAFQGGEPTLIGLLLDAGADPDSKNGTDKSPRDMAQVFDRPGIRDAIP
jgi:ankyrin repeat protein